VLLLTCLVLLVGCSSVRSTTGDGSAAGAAGATSTDQADAVRATATGQLVAVCANPPQGYTAGAYIWAIPPMALSSANSVAQVCGLGFHPRAAIMLSIARNNGAAFAPIPNLAVKTDAKGAFSTAIIVGANWICLNVRVRADEGGGRIAPPRPSPGGTPLPANALPAGCPSPPAVP